MARTSCCVAIGKTKFGLAGTTPVTPKEFHFAMVTNDETVFGASLCYHFIYKY
jgi:hypothetical protein